MDASKSFWIPRRKGDIPTFLFSRREKRGHSGHSYFCGMLAYMVGACKARLTIQESNHVRADSSQGIGVGEFGHWVE
jgi:hypothetical protein